MRGQAPQIFFPRTATAGDHNKVNSYTALKKERRHYVPNMSDWEMIGRTFLITSMYRLTDTDCKGRSTAD